MSLQVPAPRCAVLVAAAGLGTRLGAPVPKAFVDLSGTSILIRAVRGVVRVPRVDEVVVIVAPDMVEQAWKLLTDDEALAPHVQPLDSVERAQADAVHISSRDSSQSGGVDSAGVSGHCTVRVVPGGKERVDSVRCGLEATAAEFVLVHDCARALTPIEVFDRVIDALDSGRDGVIPGLPVADTIKRVDSRGVIVETPVRSELVAVQTPQGFPRAVLVKSYEYWDRHPSEVVTDDSSLVEAAGGEVIVVEGHPAAMKVTVPSDLDLAQRFVENGH